MTFTCSRGVLRTGDLRRRIRPIELRPTFHHAHCDADGSWIAGPDAWRERQLHDIEAAALEVAEPLGVVLGQGVQPAQLGLHVQIRGFLGHVELRADLPVRGARNPELERLHRSVTLSGVFTTRTLARVSFDGHVLPSNVLPRLAAG